MICISFSHAGPDPLISNRGGRGQSASSSSAAAHLAVGTVTSDAGPRTRIRRAIIGADGHRCEPNGGRPGIGQEDGRCAGLLRFGHERYAASSTRADRSIANCFPPLSSPAIPQWTVEGGKAKSSGNAFEARRLISGRANKRSSRRRDRYRNHERQRRVASRRVLHAKAGGGG